LYFSSIVLFSNFRIVAIPSRNVYALYFPSIVELIAPFKLQLPSLLAIVTTSATSPWMAANSTSSPSSKLLAVLRKRKPIDGNPSSTIAALVSKSLPMLTIGSAPVAAEAQKRDITNAGCLPDTDPSSDGSLSRRVQESLRTVLPVVSYIVQPIPVAGAPLMAAVGGLLEILKAADVSSDMA
jgi:hypothetical protein